MKYLILFLISATASAGVITVQENGRTKTYDTADYLVIKRRPKKKKLVAKPQAKPASQVAQAPEKPKFIREVVTQTEFVTLKNRIRVMGGLGPNGIAVDGGPSAYDVTPSQRLVGGIGYSRLLNDSVSLDAQVLTNKTYTLGVGLDW